jgi:hypothetical protein
MTHSSFDMVSIPTEIQYATIIHKEIKNSNKMVMEK